MEEKKDLLTEIGLKGQNSFGQLQYLLLEKLTKLYSYLHGPTTTVDGISDTPKDYKEWESQFNLILSHIKEVASGGKLNTIKHTLEPWCAVELALRLRALVELCQNVLSIVERIYRFDHIQGYMDGQKRYIVIDRLLRTELEKVDSYFWVKEDKEDDSIHASIITHSTLNKTHLKAQLMDIGSHCKWILELHHAVLNKKVEENIG